MITITIRYRGEVAELVRTKGARRPVVSGVADTTANADATGAVSLIRRLPAPTSIKDAVEATGVPHGEIGRVTRSSEHDTVGKPRPVSPDELVADGDVLDIEAPAQLPLPRAGFICDQHLGKLARMLRIMGFDVLHGDDWREEEVARRAINEHRALLSRGRAVLMRKAVTVGLLIRSDRCDRQAVEVARRFSIAAAVQLFGRCGLCNGRLRTVAKQQVANRIPPRTAHWLDEYYLCTSCDQLYWEGTHVPILRQRVAWILAQAGE